MRKAIALFITLAILISSLVCSLSAQPGENTKEPVSQAQPDYPSGTAAPPLEPDVPAGSLPPAPNLSSLTQENKDWLSELLSQDEIVGDYYEQDFDEDGNIDELIYAFESEKLEDHVWAESNLVYRLVGTDEFERLLRIGFYNFNPEARHIDYIYDISKDFASHVDELEFSVPPAEIIQPDPVIRIVLDLDGYTQSNHLPGVHTVAYHPVGLETRQDDDFREFYEVVAKLHRQESIEDAKRALRVEAYKLARNICETRTGKERSACFFNLVVDFGRNNKVFLDLCDEIDENTRLICRAVVLGKQTCDDAIDASKREVCYAYHIGMVCGDLPKADQPFCIIKLAMEDKIPLACMNLSEDDHINYCLAGVSKDSDWCKKINNPELKKMCEALFGKPAVPPPAESVEGESAPTDSLPPAAAPTETQPAGAGDGSVDVEQLSDEDCDQFLSAFPNMVVWNAAFHINPEGYGYETMAAISCDFDNDLDLDDPAYRAARVSIVFYFSQEQASESYLTHYGPDPEAYARAQKSIKSGTPIAYDTLDEWYFFSLKITEGRYNNEGRTRWENAVIFYDQTRADSNSEDTWDQVVAIAKSLMQSRASP